MGSRIAFGGAVRRPFLCLVKKVLARNLLCSVGSACLRM